MKARFKIQPRIDGLVTVIDPITGLSYVSTKPSIGIAQLQREVENRS